MFLLTNISFSRSVHEKTIRKSEYIVQMKEDKMDIIEKAFKKYEIVELRPISEHQFFMKLKKDPGLKVLRNQIKKYRQIESVNHNYIYHKLKKR